MHCRISPRIGQIATLTEERDTFTRLPWLPDEGHREGVQMLATNSPSPFDLKLRMQRESEAEENRKRDAERAELLAHEDQFITISEIGRAIVESGREGYTGNLWQAIHDTLNGEPEAVIFCHWEGGERWTPLPSPDVCPAVVGAGHTVEPAARFGREPMKGPIGYYIGGCFIATGDGAAFAIRRDLAGRLFDLPEPASAPREAIATPTTAPSASAPAVAVPEPVALPAEAVPSECVVRHTLKTRRNPLAAVFARAKQEATDSTCPHSVWAALSAMAQGSNPPPELTDFDNAKGIQATGARDGWLSKNAFMDRWRRGNV